MTKSRLDEMRANPAADWTIGDVEAVCRQRGFRCIYMIPRRRTIKPVYIRDFVRFIDAIEAEIQND